MSTYVEPSEFDSKYEDNIMYVVLSFQLPTNVLGRAERFIESMRIAHNKLACFVKHTCMCNSDGVTLWKFAYLTPQYYDNNMESVIKNLWDAQFKEIGRSAEQLLTRDRNCMHAEGLRPCICPFSVKGD